jgi:hypothetical protein
MKTQTTFLNEKLIYTLIFGLAVGLRLLLLGEVPLVDSESSLALQAWQILERDQIISGSQVTYLAFTNALFSLFGGGVFLARLTPAIIGSMLILVPFLIRDKIGAAPAILMAAGLALDPALVSVSRIVGSPIPAMVFLLFAGTFLQIGLIPLSLSFLVLSLMSGPGFWLGAILIGITVIICARLEIVKPRDYFKNRLIRAGDQEDKGRPGFIDYILPGLVFLVIGSFFFSRIQGLSAWSVSIAEFFTGWTTRPVLHPAGIPIRLIVSNPLILIFGLLGFINSWRKNEKLAKIASIWFATGLVLLLIYPGRQSVDLIWLVIPLWLATANELVRLFRLGKDAWSVWALAGLIGVLATLNWLTLTGMVFQLGNQRAVLLQLGLFAASLALIILALTIIASEWDWPTAAKGLTIGASVMLLAFTFSGTTLGAYRYFGDPRSLWFDHSGAGQMDLLLDTVGEISITETGRWDSIEGAVLNGTDSIHWLLRDLDQFESIESYDAQYLPPILITTQDMQYQVPVESYRGQDFVIRTKPGWEGLVPPDWISWVAFRDGPIQNEYIILWVRGDILAGDE